MEKRFCLLVVEKLARYKGKLGGDHRGFRAAEGLTEKAKVEN